MHRAQTIMYYKMPGSKVLSTTSFNVPEDDTPKKPFVRAVNAPPVSVIIPD